MGKLSTYRRNRKLRRAEEKALRKKATIEAKAGAKAQAAAEKVRAKVDRKQLREAAKKAAKSAREEARNASKAAKKTARDLDKQAQAKHKAKVKQSKELAGLELKHTKAQDKATTRKLAKEAKLEAKRAKALAKDAKAGRAHEEKMAAMELKKIEAGQINRSTAKRYVAFAQVLLPVVAPLALKGITSAQGQGALPAAANPGSALLNRIDSINDTIDKLAANRGDEQEIQAFAERSRSRLKDLGTAVESAEHVPTRERRTIHQSVSDELNRVNKDVLARLGVQA